MLLHKALEREHFVLRSFNQVRNVKRPLLLFGAGKPVLVRAHVARRPKKDLKRGSTLLGWTIQGTPVARENMRRVTHRFTLHLFREQHGILPVCFVGPSAHVAHDLVTGTTRTQKQSARRQHKHVSEHR